MCAGTDLGVSFENKTNQNFGEWRQEVPQFARASQSSRFVFRGRGNFTLEFYNPAAVSNPRTPCWSDVGLHALLQRPRQVRVLRGGLGIVGGGRGRSLAVFVELHVALRFTVAADAAVTLRVDEGAGVAERGALELALTQLDGAAAHAQHKALAVVIKAIGTGPKSGVDVGEGHAGGNPLLAEGPCAAGVPRLRGLIPSHGGRVVLLEGVDAVVAICWVLLKAHEILTLP